MQLFPFPVLVYIVCVQGGFFAALILDATTDLRFTFRKHLVTRLHLGNT